MAVRVVAALVHLLAVMNTHAIVMNLRSTNPLIDDLHESFPPYDRVQAKHVQPAMQELLKVAEKEVSRLEDKIEEGAFADHPAELLKQHRRIGDDLFRAWGIANQLQSVMNSDELRDANEQSQSSIVEFNQRCSQSKILYGAFKALRDGDGFAQLNPAQKRLVTMEVDSFELGGVGLEGKQLEEFNSISQDLTKLSTQYTNNDVDSTAAWSKLVSSSDALEGLPEATLKLAAEGAKAKGKTGYLLTLDAPSASAVLSYAEDRELREEVYRASASKASDISGTDNEPVLRQILNLRQKKANLLGFDDYVELSMHRKMATSAEAEKLLEDLREIAYPKAVKDLESLQKFAADQKFEGELKQWDLSYWSNKQRKEVFDIDPEELRPYFPLEQSLGSLFKLMHQMYGISFEEIKGPTWHKDVKLFAVRREHDCLLHSCRWGEKPIAHFYVDLFTRPGQKNSGAWQSAARNYDSDMDETAIAVIVANFRPPVSGQPALLSFGELHTLFHEMGHAMQTMLTTQQEPSFAGTMGVEWDAVELPSQFNEYFLDEMDSVTNELAKHFETGKSLPKEKLEQVKASTKFQAGMGMLGQVHLSLIDLDLHKHPLKDSESAHDRDVAFSQKKHTKLLTALPEDRFLCHFSHIFAGGYAAGYYSYKWAEVLSADAFDLFAAAGATDSTKKEQEVRLRELGEKFAATVLGEGGGRKAKDVFRAFRGRSPDTKAFLHYKFGDDK